MICPKCHTRNRDDDFVCTKCAHRLIAIEQRVSAPRTCPAGKHPMDPDWTECPYCDDPESAAPEPAQRVSRPSFTDDETRTHEQAPRVQRQSTRFNAGAPYVSSQPAERQPNGQHAGRRMVGLVVTYSWRREGQVFAVYEGRNYLGKDPDCEVRLTADQSLSGKHAAIFYRGRSFTITDEKSMNGTFVNGTETPISGMPLSNYDEVKTGATTWRFIIIEPQAANGDR